MVDTRGLLNVPTGNALTRKRGTHGTILVERMNCRAHRVLPLSLDCQEAREELVGPYLAWEVTCKGFRGKP